MAIQPVETGLRTNGPGIFALRNEEGLAVGNIRKRNGTDGRQFDTVFDHAWFDLFTSVKNAIGQGFATTGEGVEIFVFEPAAAYTEITKAVGNHPVVTLDPLYPKYLGRNQEGGPIQQVVPLRTSRWFLPGTKTQLGIDRRPVFPPILEQLKSIRSAIGDKDVVIVEDDGYTLGTVAKIITMMNRDGIGVREVFLGMKSGKPVELEIPITAVVSFDNRNLVDMMDGRNSLFGAYTAGAVISFPEDNTVGRWPYIPPLVDPIERISLPPDAVPNYARRIANANISFYDGIDRQTGRPVRLEDTSFSFRVGLRHALPIDISPDTPMQKVSAMILNHLETTNFSVASPSTDLIQFNP